MHSVYGMELGVVYRQAAEVVGYSDAALKVLPHAAYSSYRPFLSRPPTACGSA